MSPAGQLDELTLFSSSPRRRGLLEGLVARLTVVAPSSREMPVSEPRSLVNNAMAKLGSARGLAVAADTAVFLDDVALGKPTGPEDAKRMLRALSGRWHGVSTGIAVSFGEEVETALVTTRVLFREISDQDIDSYVATGEPLDKAGAYGIQGIGGRFVERIEGDYDNVVGLPVTTLREILAARGFRL